MNSPAEIKILQPGDELALERFLLLRLDSSLVLLGNLRTVGLRDHDTRWAGLQGSHIDAGPSGIVGVVAHTGQGNLLCQAPLYVDTLWRTAIQHTRRGVWANGASDPYPTGVGGCTGQCANR